MAFHLSRANAKKMCSWQRQSGSVKECRSVLAFPLVTIAHNNNAFNGCWALWAAIEVCASFPLNLFLSAVLKKIPMSQVQSTLIRVQVKINSQTYLFFPSVSMYTSATSSQSIFYCFLLWGSKRTLGSRIPHAFSFTESTNIYTVYIYTRFLIL